MPGTRRMLAFTRLCLAQRRTCLSASTRRNERGEAALSGRVSATHAPPQSPYTPLVLMYTSRLGNVACDKTPSRLRVRVSVATNPPCPPFPKGGEYMSSPVLWVPPFVKGGRRRDFSALGGAKCSTASASPAMRDRLVLSSRS